MARYKKVDTRIWGDQKFRNLSPPKPCGQALWWRIIVPRESTNIPGLFVTTQSALAESLHWPLKATKKAFEEIQDQGMAVADWNSGLVFLPNGIKYHKPENPNVIKSWRSPWDEIPECDLKWTAYDALRGFIAKELSKPFLEAFDEVIPKPSRDGSPPAFTETFSKSGAQAEAGTQAGPLSDLNPNIENTASFNSANDDEYRAQIQSIVAALPNVKIRQIKESYLKDLSNRRVPPATVEAACWIAMARKLATENNAGPIISFGYFLQTIDEVFQTPIPPGYLEYVKQKVLSVFLDAGIHAVSD